MKNTFDPKDGTKTFVLEAVDRRCLLRAQSMLDTITGNEPDKEISRVATVAFNGLQTVLKHYTPKPKAAAPEPPPADESK